MFYRIHLSRTTARLLCARLKVRMPRLGYEVRLDSKSDPYAVRLQNEAGYFKIDPGANQAHVIADEYGLTLTAFNWETARAYAHGRRDVQGWDYLARNARHNTQQNETQRDGSTGTRQWDVYWSPEGRKIATVEATTEREAIRKAPQPYRKYLGEMYAKETGK